MRGWEKVMVTMMVMVMVIVMMMMGDGGWRDEKAPDKQALISQVSVLLLLLVF